MSCKYSSSIHEFHGWGCSVTGGACAFVFPDSIACALEYGEGPDADKPVDELKELVAAGQSRMLKLANDDAEEERLIEDENDDYYDDDDYDD